MDRIQTLTPATSPLPPHTWAGDAAPGVDVGRSPRPLLETARWEAASNGPPRPLDSRQAGRHRLAVAVGLQRAGPGAVASHWSAAVLHGLPVPRWPDLEVHLTVAADHRPRPDGVRLHPAGPVADHQLANADGLPATSVARTVVDVSAQAPWPEAVILADAALHLGHVTHDDLRTALAERMSHPGHLGHVNHHNHRTAPADASAHPGHVNHDDPHTLLAERASHPGHVDHDDPRTGPADASAHLNHVDHDDPHTLLAERASHPGHVDHDDPRTAPADASAHPGHVDHDDPRTLLAERARWPGARLAASVVDLASDRAASALETLARVLLVHELALPPPLLNPWVFDATGRAVTQVAMLWPQWRTIAEPADDGDSYRPAGAPTPFLRQFRARQLRSLDYRVVHWTWRDLTHHPDRLAARIRPLPSRWRKEVS